jgi:hypothetical protein
MIVTKEQAIELAMTSGFECERDSIRVVSNNTHMAIYPMYIKVEVILPLLQLAADAGRSDLDLPALAKECAHAVKKCPFIRFGFNEQETADMVAVILTALTERLGSE